MPSGCSNFRMVGALSTKDAEVAMIEPVRNEGERIAKGAVDLIVDASVGYPYFLQAWGYDGWNTADKSPISKRTSKHRRDPS